MTTVFIDLTGEEAHWNGETGVEVIDGDGLTGRDHALRLRNDTEIILTTTQMITLFDTLDAWLHGGPLTELGAVRGRIRKALVECLGDHDLKVTNKSGDLRTHEGFAATLEEYMRTHGLRFRIKGEDDRADLLARRDPANPLRDP